MANEYYRPRPDMKSVTPELYEYMLGFNRLRTNSGLDDKLRTLIKVRVSQINGCAYCLDMHIGEARRQGISDDKMQLITVWRNAPGIPGYEQVAFELAEAVTNIADGGVSPELYERVREHYTAEQYIWLLAEINVINSWNRFMIGLAVAPAVHSPTS